MSKIGEHYLKLQEKVNELGYDTVEEAIADGWDSAEYFSSFRNHDEQLEAHKAWVKERDILLGDLFNLWLGYAASGKSDTTEADIILRARDFIKRGEI